MSNDDKKTGAKAPKPGRRRLIKGAAAAPVLMTLASRPAWGVGGGNFCWSGIQSGNLSGHDHNTCEFGRSPGYYKTHVGNAWPTAYMYESGCDQPYAIVPDEWKHTFADDNNGPNSLAGLQFSTLFGFSGPAHDGMNYDGYTVMQVLWLSKFAGSFGFHAIATYFNTLNFPGYAFRPEDAMEIIQTILATGRYTNEFGQTWYQDQMKCLFDASYHPADEHDKNCM